MSIPPHPRSCRICLRRTECITIRTVLLAYTLAPDAFDNSLYQAYDRLGDHCRFFKSPSDPPDSYHNADIFFSRHQANLREALTITPENLDDKLNVHLL